MIVHEPGTVPGHLAAVTGMRPSNVSTVLRHLTELGMIERETDPADRRSSRIMPTHKASARPDRHSGDSRRRGSHPPISS